MSYVKITGLQEAAKETSYISKRGDDYVQILVDLSTHDLIPIYHINSREYSYSDCEDVVCLCSVYHPMTVEELEQCCREALEQLDQREDDMMWY